MTDIERVKEFVEIELRHAEKRRDFAFSKSAWDRAYGVVMFASTHLLPRIEADELSKWYSYEMYDKFRDAV